MRCQLILAFGLVALPAARAGTEAKKATKPTEVEVRFGDGSKVRMLLLQESIEIVTKYGKLQVPTSDIRDIDVGIHLPEGVEEKIEKALQRLGGKAFKDRDAAVNELVELGPHAYPALKAAAKSSELEIAQRAQTAIKRLELKFGTELLRVQANDRILTTDFPISGRIISPSIKAKTPYFGELALKLPELRSIRWLSGQADASVAVDAAKYANNVQWLDTGVTLDGTTGVTITATGEIDLMNDGSGDFVCGPTGSRNFGGFGPMRKGGVARLPGSLMGRIGETGQPFYIGANYHTAQAPAGKLYLQIVPAPFNNGQPPTGAFKVSIRAGNFFDGR
jgi:hypothetical protein